MAPEVVPGVLRVTWPRRRKWRTSLVVFAVLLALLAWPGYAATFTVTSTADAVDCNPGDGVAETAPGNGVCTLRAAIMEANALPGADAINLPAGTYALTIAGANEDACTTGDLDITGDLTITGAGADVTRVGGDLDRVFHVLGSSTSCTLTGLTVEGGDVSGDGGGVYNEGTATLSSCSFECNTCTGSGGGLYNGSGTATISRSTFYANEAGGDGGGIFGQGTFTDCLFVYNITEASGGAVAGLGKFTNSTFTNNYAGVYGGGLWLRACTSDLDRVFSIVNCTIVKNNAQHGGGICMAGLGSSLEADATAQVGNSIVARNTTTSWNGMDLWVGNEHGSFSSLGHNIIGDGSDSSAFVNGVNGDQVGTSGTLVELFLGPLQDNGGPTQTRALCAGSPALDAGDNALVTNPPFDGPPYYDQRGEGYDRISDADGNGTATVDIGAFEAQAPEAYDDAYEVDEGGTLEVPAAGVLENDIADVGEALTAAVVTGSACGSLTLNEDGSFTYAHDGSETTVDSFVYAASNGIGVAQGTVTITINPVNDAATAVADGYTVVEGATLSVNAASGVLANDWDAEGDPFTAVLVTSPAHGNLTFNANGSFVYVHGGGEAPGDSFTYCANDGTGNGPAATVTITVTPVNDIPVANNDAYTVQRGETLVVPAPGVLANEVDAEGATLVPALLSDPSHGSLTLNANGSFTYAHDGTATVSDGFTYRVSDGTATSNTASVTLAIDIANDPPTDILLSNAAVAEGQPVGTLVGTLTAVDPDHGETRTFTLVAGAGSDGNGAFQIEAAPGGQAAYLRTAAKFLYEVQSSYTIRVRVDDGNGGVFEKAFVVSVTNVSSDLDGDGLSDTDEAAAGTDPFDTANPTATMSVTPKTITAPSQGGTLTAAVTNSGIGVLTWNATVTSGASWLTITAGASGSIGGTVRATCTKNQSGAARTGVIRVTSPNAVGSPADVVVTQPLCGLPDAPTNIQATDGTETASVVVTWTAVSGASSYAVYRGGTSGFAAASLLGTATTTCYVDTTAAAATASSGCSGTQKTVYYYWVAAVNGSGVSSPCGPDTGYCGVAGRKASVYEEVLPALETGDGMRAAHIDSSLAIRLRAGEAIDPDTVWGTVASSALHTELVSWQAVSEADGWVVYEPGELWPFGEAVVMTAGATTVSGAAVGPVTCTFQVESEETLLARQAKALDALWQPQLEDYEAMGMAVEDHVATVALAAADVVPALANGVGPVYTIGPDALFDAPQWVWLPVPDGTEAGELALCYFKTGADGAGWHPGDAVEGWLVPESTVQSDFAGTCYLGIQVRHGGTIQLAPKGLSPPRPAALFHGDAVILGCLVTALLLARRRMRHA